MKALVKFVLFLNMIMSFSSCNLLEENPKDFVTPENFYKTEDETLAALYGVYQFMHKDIIGGYMKIFIGDLGVDEMLCRPMIRLDVCQYYQMESPTIEYSDCWREHYNAIGAANMLINKVTLSTLNEDFKSKVISEAKTLRAFYYFGLVLMWGDVPFWLDPLDINVVSSLPRTSKSEIINQLNTDLDEASEILPDSYDSSNIGRLTKWAAKALQARINLMENNWEKAYELSNDIIDNSPHELLSNYNDVFNFRNKDVNNKEMIFLVSCVSDIHGSNIHTFCSPRVADESAKFDKLFNNGLTTIRPDGVVVSKSNQLFQGWGMFATSESLLDSYEVGDRRKEMMDWNGQTMSDGTFVAFDGGNGGGSGHYTLKWAAFDEKSNNGSRDVHQIRLAEIYLIKAEAANELGKYSEAIEALNILRERAFGDSNHNYSSSMSKEEIKRAIVNENKWELAGEGVRRWYLCHWGYDYLYEAVQSLKVENPKAASNIKPHHVLFKIPVEEFIKNPNLGENNPGY